MTNKLTQKQLFNAIIAQLNGEVTEVSVTEMVEFCQGRIVQLEKKNATRKTGLTETQKENLEFAKKFVAFMATQPEKEWLISEIRKEFGLSSQRVTPIMTKLVEAGRVVKIVEKRVNFFKLA